MPPWWSKPLKGEEEQEKEGDMRKIHFVVAKRLQSLSILIMLTLN